MRITILFSKVRATEIRRTISCGISFLLDAIETDVQSLPLSKPIINNPKNAWRWLAQLNSKAEFSESQAIQALCVHHRELLMEDAGVCRR
jgi:hypothetical protein